MDRLKGLEAHIMGLNIHYSGVFLLSCTPCKVSWEAWMFFELGGWFFSRQQPVGEAEGRAYCPHCGKEGGNLRRETTKCYTEE